MRRPDIEPTCAICDVPLYDDPHWSGELEAFCCEQHCDNEGCLNLPGGGFVPDDTASPATGDDSAHTQRRLPAAGKLPFPIATRLMKDWTLDSLRDCTDADPDTDCWIWRYGTDRDGYGAFKFDGRRWAAHRAAYVLGRGPIPEGLTVDHICFVRSCLNPEHLRLLTVAENVGRTRPSIATHCRRGHEYTPENTYTSPEGWRLCRACKAATSRRSYARRRQASGAATGLLPDDSTRIRPGDDRATTHGPIVPAVGELHS